MSLTALSSLGGGVCYQPHILTEKETEDTRREIAKVKLARIFRNEISKQLARITEKSFGACCSFYVLF